VTGSSLSSLQGEYRGIYYSWLHEFGGTVTPTTAKVLTLPLPAALRSDGTPKLKSPRSWKRFGTFSYTSKKTGQSYLVYKGSDGKLVFLYVYIKYATFFPRLGLRDTHRENLSQLIDVWSGIFINEMGNLDLMRVIDSGGKEFEVYDKQLTSVIRKFKPRISLQGRKLLYGKF
jgi:hypothetical protein